MEYTSVSSVQRTSRAKAIGLIALAVFGTLVASYAVFSAVPVKTGLLQVYTDANSSTCTPDEYNDWKKTHGLKLDLQEDVQRFNQWCKSHQYINNHNSGNHSWQVGHNQFSHLSNAEFIAIHTGAFHPDRHPNNQSSHTNNDRILASLPTSVNWVTQGAVTAVKNQGQCGSCWSFASSGALEGLAKIKTKSLPTLSEQQFLDCTNGITKYDCSGCNGGWPGGAFQYIIDNKGISSEAAYPYKGAVQTCNKAVAKAFTGLVGYTVLPANSATAILTAIAAGPVVVMLDVDQSFQLYKSGIFADTKCGTTVNHATLAVGYNTQSKYYLVKNSWATTWGESGYFQIGITGNDPGVCGFQQWSVSVN